MAGFIGVMDTAGRGDARRRFEAGRDRMLRHGRLAATTVTTPDGAWWLGHIDFASRIGPSTAEVRVADVPTALFHGVLYNERDLRRALQTGDVATTDLIAALYKVYGAHFVDHLDGEFAVIVADPARRQLFAATDHVGSYPIYWRADANGLILSSDLSALLAAGTFARRVNLRAVADYLTIGAVLGDKTLVDGVLLLDPGTLLRYDAGQDRISLHSYVQLESFFQDKAVDKRDYLEHVTKAFANAVGRALDGPGPMGLSLSGGLDSRAILSAANGRAASLRTYTLGIDGCADQAIAGKLSRIAGTRHHYFELDSRYLSDFLPNMAQMVSITDGMYLSHGLTEMLALQFLDDTGIAVLLRGHGGELAKAHLAWPLHTDDHVRRMGSIDELIPYLSRRANYITRDLDLRTLFTPDAFASAGNGTHDTFATALSGTGLSPAEACSYLYLRELHRRFTVPSLELFRTRVEVRLPYVEAGFLKVLLGAPAGWRDSTVIHQAITASGIERLLAVRNSNTGARADAGPLTEFVLDKCNTALKRLNVRGYRHYHDFDGWMRRMLLQTVEAELLAPGARVQAFMPRPVLEGLLRDTRDERADRSYLLQVLLILELWQRENGVEAAA